jgi:hypothetical protein
VKKGRKEIAKKLTEACHEAMQSHVSSVATTHATIAVHDTSVNTIQSTMHAALGSTLAASIAHNVALMLAHAFHTEIVKFLASAAFHKLLMTAIGHSIYVLVTTLMVKLLATTVGVTAGSAWLGPAAWAVGGTYVLYRILTIPDKLGESLGKAVEDDLQGKFRPWTETAMKKFLKESFDVEKLLETVVKGELDQTEASYLEEKFGLDDTDQDTKDLEKDVDYISGKGKKAGKSLWKKWWS